ncbi:arginine--tRNA ligase [Candidatus Woesearchaeota archaeon]|nr:arginine--tRNA ligase [Candidatus Woesearchaeota archaeon]
MKEIVEALKNVVEAEIQLEVPPDTKLGDYAFPCFSLARIYKKSPQEIAVELAKKIVKPDSVEKIEANGPYINFFLKKSSIAHDALKQAIMEDYGRKQQGKTIMVEFLSPNTNKPLHLGHLRNIFLGTAVSNCLEFLGNNVIKANLINDRGVHICKSMLAYHKWGSNAEPNKKPDHFVGDFYVMYSSREDDALKAEIQDMLVKWEQKNPEVRNLWKKMNRWALQGFKQTFGKIGLKFDKEYYESKIYNRGKNLVIGGYEKGIFQKGGDGAIIIDLEKDGLGQKVLLRANGTSVYITQDLYLAIEKFEDFPISRSIYVVGSEQDYHFRVLKIILKKLNFSHADDVFHLSYGMVFLPEGKMKSREGKVVDADDIIDEIISLSNSEIGKRYPKLSEKEKSRRASRIGLAALRFYLLRIDPSKSMTYHPEESLSFEGETGPYVQYTYARISSILRKYGKKMPENVDYALLDKDLEIEIIKLISGFPDVVEDAGTRLKVHVIPHFLLNLSQAFNEYYHKYPILKEASNVRDARIVLISCVRQVIRTGLELLDIDVLERM